jgi:GTP-binding protein
MFVDSVRITLRAGKGGNGVVAWRREKFIPKGGPSGGNGGKGGSIYLETDNQIVSLQAYRNRRLLAADNGLAGGGNLRQGRSGEDLILKVPPGTLVKDIRTDKVLFDLTEDKQTILLCKGGRGGKGNNCFKSPTNQAPNICTPGTEGESLEIELELKLIADVGLVGMPNAGKSTLMSKMTHLPVKIAPYPFTTLHPNLSYIQRPDASRILVADIPGLIENAHLNKGLGISFLRHIERSSALVFVIDISGIEGRDPLEDYRVLQRELKAYRSTLLDKPFVIALNKIDAEGAEAQAAQFRNAVDLPPSQLFEISAINHKGLSPLIEAISTLTACIAPHNLQESLP